jgi:hypothetical protein
MLHPDTLSDPVPTSIFSYSLMLHAWRRKQSKAFGLTPTKDRNNDFPKLTETIL